MAERTVVFIDSIFPDLSVEEGILKPAGATLVDGRCRTLEEVISVTRGAVAMVTTAFKPIGEEIFSACPSLKLIVRTGIGVDTIDLSAATRHGIRVCNVPDYCLQEVSDHTVALLLSLARKIPLADRRMKAGQFSYYAYLKPVARLQGKTVGFLGFGRIGRLVARKLSGFDVRMIFCDPYVSQEGIESARKASLEETLRESDYLCIHAPETPETRHLLNERTLSLMKPSAFVVNTARGGIIDTAALVEMLRSGRLAGAALDVLEDETAITADHPLCRMENVILTPHAAWYSEDSLVALREKVAQEVARFIQGEPLASMVNPEVLAAPQPRPKG
jgi:D-3-phosphoglycerate dehydrogenase / 2-oxoglutarate reductase